MINDIFIIFSIIILALAIMLFINQCRLKRIYKKLERNRKVYEYRVSIIKRYPPEKAEEMLEKYSYDFMMDSSLPLEDKYWYNEK